MTQHGCDHKETCDSGGEPQHEPSSQTLQYCRADEAAHHCAAPVESDVPGGGPLWHGCDLRQAEVTDQEAAVGNLCADVEEDSERSHQEPSVTPNAALTAERFSVLSWAKVACDVTGDQWWQLDEREGKCKGEERKSYTEIGDPDRRSLLGLVRLQQRGR